MSISRRAHGGNRLREQAAECEEQRLCARRIQPVRVIGVERDSGGRAGARS